MEYIQGFLFASQYIFGNSSNTNIFFFFAIVALFFYTWKRHDKLKLILMISIPITVICAVMAIGYPWTDADRCIIFAAKMILDITLMVFVAYNCQKWKMIRFLEVIVWIHALETAIALMLPNSTLWVSEYLVQGGDTVSRLRLFYLDAGSMAFVSGLVVVMLVYQLLTEEVIWRQVLGVSVMAVDLYLAYGLGGIACAMLAIAMLLIVVCIKKRESLDIKEYKKYVKVSLIGCIFSLFLLGANSIYMGRVRGIVDGTDYILQTKLLNPLESITTVLKTTHYLGVGFGNANTSVALELLNANKAYPNSFLRIIAEGGVFGIVLVLLCVVGLGYYSFKYGNIFSRALYLYIISFQFIGGYFTDPTNFFVYGWILGDCLHNKVLQTGNCRIKLFVPQKKDKLRIAMIGHKHIPGREGGVEIVVEEISKRMVKLGNEVDAYNRSGQHISGAEYNTVDYDALTEYEGIKIIKIPTIQRKGFAAMIYSFIASIRVVIKDYDIVHYHAEGPCAFLWIPSLFGIRTVATIHGLDWARNGKWGSLASTFIKMGERIAVEFADDIIVLGRNIQQYFRDTYNRDTVLIPNGVNRPERKAAELIKGKWKLDSAEYFLSLSRITKEKKCDLLIEAFKQVSTDKKLVIAGGSSDSDGYVNQLHELAKDDSRIIFTGFVQGRELEELYSNAYVYCLPSELEGMPLSLLEAMSYGNCCLTSDIPECAEVIRDKGVSFITNDKGDLIRELQRLDNEPDVVENYRKQSADYICNKYNWDDVTNRTLNLYRGDSDENSAN